MSIEAMRQALEFAELASEEYTVTGPRTVASLRAAIEAAEKAEPVAYAVYWGLVQMRRNSVHFEKETAEAAAAQIKSVTEIRPLYTAAPSPAAVEDRKDAERYRWLRENVYVEDGCLEIAKNIYCHEAPNKADIDTAIDAAMRADSEKR